MMTPPFNSNDHWSPCPIGYLQRYALVEKRQTLLRLAGRVTAVVALLAVTASAAVYSYRSISPSSAPTLSAPACHEIAPLLEDFKANKLSPEASSKVRQHLDRCAHCGSLAGQHVVTPPDSQECPAHATPPGAPVTTP